MDDQLYANMRRMLARSLAASLDELARGMLLNSSTFTTSAVERTSLTMDDLKKAIELLPPKPKYTFPMKIITSEFCYKTKIEVRGIADKRRPNNKKPLYRKVKVFYPLAYRTPFGIVCHPSLVEKFRRAIEKENKKWTQDKEDLNN
jgi:hypothetical protein